VETLLGRINHEMHRSVTHIGKDVLECFNNYDWPGNVRELENILMKTVALSSGDSLTRDMLPDMMSCGASSSFEQPEMSRDQLSGKSLAEVEKAHVVRVLSEVNWHKGRACEILGVSRPRLRRLIRDYDIVAPSEITDMDDDRD
jgi:transcriptional regulator with PAS, ATPase and Fis domain